MDKMNRYNFGGWTFGEGDHKQFNLQIRIVNNANHGTNYTTEIGIELTDLERQELIALLINPMDAE